MIQIEDNMKCLYENADHTITEDEYAQFTKLKKRAETLARCNGAFYAGIYRSRAAHVTWIYEGRQQISKTAFDQLLKDLYSVRMPKPY